jgi:hypothetical protein
MPLPIVPSFQNWAWQRPSMLTLFQGRSWVEWLIQKKEFISLYLFTHFDQPMIQTDQQRISHSFSRALFYGHGLCLFQRNPDPSFYLIPSHCIPSLVPIETWFQQKMIPWNPSHTQTTITLYDLRLKQFWNSKQFYLKTSSAPNVGCPWTVPSQWTSMQLSLFLSSLHIEQIYSQPTNYTTTPLIDVCLNSTPSAIPLLGVPRDLNRNYYMVIDVGTSHCPGLVQPEQVTLKDIAYILFDDTGKTLVEQTIKISSDQPVSSYLFFLQLATLLRDYQAEIVAYNGAFDAVVLSRWMYNPVVTHLLNVWNHDVQYMVMNRLKTDRACKLSTAYTKILKREPEWKKWHISINDCQGTKEIFCHLLSSK